MDEAEPWASFDAGGKGRSVAARKGRFDWLILGSAFLTLVLTFYLVLQAVTAGFDSPTEPTSKEIMGYWLLAAIIIGIQVALVVRAIRLSRGGLLFIAVLALIMAIGVSLALSVPQIDWKSGAPVHTSDPHRPACYSGSGDCLGG